MATAMTLGDPEASAHREEFVSRALAALEKRDLSGALELAEDAKKGDKAGLVAQIEALAAALAMQARATVGEADRRADSAAVRHAFALAAVQVQQLNSSTATRRRSSPSRRC